MSSLRSALLSAFIVVNAAAAAATVDEELQWLCWLASRPDYSLRCQLEVDPLLDDDLLPTARDEATPGGAQPPAAVDSVQLRHALFAAGAAPNVARLVREQPARYAKLVWTIPLHGPPIEDEHVRELAQSVLCGASAHCRAHFGMQLTPLSIAVR